MGRKIHAFCLSARKRFQLTRHLVPWLSQGADYGGWRDNKQQSNWHYHTSASCRKTETREREREEIKIPFSSSCLPGTLCLIALLLMKCWCNYKKEALFLVPFLSFCLDWGHGITEHSLCPFASYFKQTYFVSPSVNWSSPSHHLLLPSVMLQEEQVGHLN